MSTEQCVLTLCMVYEAAMGWDQGCGAEAGAAGADTFWPEPEPEPPKRFVRSRSRSRSCQKRCGSGSEKGYNCGKKNIIRNNEKQPNKQFS